MGIHSEYLYKNMSFEELKAERKNQLRIISKLRGDGDIII
jgi:hypothetical protein